MSNIPVIKITIDHMRHSLLSAMSDYAVQLDEQIKLAVDDALQPDRIQKFLNDIARKEIDLAIEKCVSGYFRRGDGARAVESVVMQQLKEREGLMNYE